MTKLLSLVIAMAVSQAAGLSMRPAQFENVEKRQLGGLVQLMGAMSGGKLGSFMGDPAATEALTALAKTLGANKNSAGGMRTYTINSLNAGWGPVAAPTGSAAKRVEMKSRTKTPGAKAVKVRYGPYKIPSSAKKNMLGENGMLSNYPDTNLDKPCAGDCTIIGMEAGLEYANGTNANINTGLWLHHMVLFNIGTGREDFTCSHRDISVPHATIGATPRNSERIFASGNERTPAILPDWGVTDAGYKLKAADKFAALIELMNENPSDQIVWLTMTYDYVEGHPFKDHVRVIWFDVRQCGTSEVNPPAGKKQFTLDYTWQTKLNGEVVGAIEHMHDGGVRMTVGVDNVDVCDSVSEYGTKPEFVSAPPAAGASGGHSHGGGAGAKHISNQPVCYGKTLGKSQMSKGQTWNVKSHYDFGKFEGGAHADGSLEKVMGITIMFLREKN